MQAANEKTELEAAIDDFLNDLPGEILDELWKLVYLLYMEYKRSGSTIVSYSEEQVELDNNKALALLRRLQKQKIIRAEGKKYPYYGNDMEIYEFPLVAAELEDPGFIVGTAEIRVHPGRMQCLFEKLQKISKGRGNQRSSSRIPDGTPWEDVEIRFTSRDDVVITCQPNARYHTTAAEITGMAKRDGSPNRNWKLLLEIAEKCRRSSQNTTEHLPLTGLTKAKVSDLNKALAAYHDDGTGKKPLVYSKADRCYYLRPKLIPETHAADELPSAEKLYYSEKSPIKYDPNENRRLE